jgi:glutamate formiminotransferase/formiminotetrahydrofolate cyclodeaminase
VQYGNPNSITDVGVGALMAYNGVKGGVFNVLINLGQIQDADFVDEMRRTCAELEKEAAEIRDRILKTVEEKIK